jgi:PAS domain S-box-containing protein
MKIRNKILLAFFIVSILGSIYGSVYFYFVSSNLVKQEVLNHLETTAQDRASHIETYLKQNIERLKLITSRNALRNTLKSYNEEPDQDKLKTMKDIVLAAQASVDEIERVCVIGLDGNIITSTDDKFVGKNVSDRNFFIEGKSNNVINFVEEGGEKKIFVTGPYIYENELLGVGIAVVKMDLLRSIVKDKTGLAETGEVFLATKNDEELEYLTDRLFEEEALLQQNESEISIDLLKQALSGNEKVFENVLDYRNHKVLAVSQYIETGEIGLIAKIDRQEALGAVFKKLFQTSLFILASIVVFFTVVGFFVARGISRPIKRLFEGTKIIEKGDLDYKVGMSTKDEVGELSRSFDKMTLAIKKSQSEVDDKVKKQTAEIREKAKYLDNQRKAILNILEDVDEERQKTEREKEKIDAILHSIGDAVFVVDDNLKIVMFNKIAADISGFSPKEAVGQDYKRILKFIYEDNEKVNDEFIKKEMETGEIKEMSNHTLLIRKDGRKVPVADSASPLIKDGKVRGCVVVFRDVSSEREVDKAKTEFVSLASHQLRTPLSAINWYAEMLLDEDAGKLNKEQKEYLEEIYTGNQRMVDLVNALLNVSRLELGTFVIEPSMVDLKSVAENVLKELAQKIEKKKLKITKNYKGAIGKYKGDSKLLMIIFQNLISNAVKYTSQKGEIKVSVINQDNEIEIKVSDNGMGIPKDQQDKIFSKLFRADNVRSTDTQGTGLGLYIVKQIVDHCGGKIKFTSKKK